MANQAEILKFFEMMTERARNGEFRFVAIGTINQETSEIVTTVAGMATQDEAKATAYDIGCMISNGASG